MPLSSDPEARRRQLANLRPGARTAPPGNTRALRHGGYAEIARERIEERVAELLDALAADAPLRDPSGELPAPDAAIVHLLATALCRLESVERYLSAHGYLTDTGDVRPAADLAARLRREAADYLDALGMTPRSRARLGLDLSRGFDLAREWASSAQEVEHEQEDERESSDGEDLAAAHPVMPVRRDQERPDDGHEPKRAKLRGSHRTGADGNPEGDADGVEGPLHRGDDA